MRTKISVDAYEAAERELMLAHARRIWRLHAAALGTAVAALVLVELRSGGTPWLVYLVLSLWALGLAVYHRGWVRHGEERIRDQQFRIEWRAGRSSLMPRR